MKRSRRKWVLGAIGVVILLVLAVVLDTLVAAGTFRSVEPHQPGECYRIEGVVGGEDLQWRPNGEEIFVSAQDRRSLDARGHIYRVYPDREGQVVDVTPELDFSFHPHGLYLYVDDDGRERLFVVNHRGGWSPPSTIEIFDVDADGALTHVRSVQDDALKSPNDVVAVGPEEFYVTNDHGRRSSLGRTLETYLRLPLGNVVFFDGERFSEAYRGTKYANGINVSADGRELYLAETVRRTVKIFDRDPETHEIQWRETIPVKTGVDNIDVAADGSLWVAAHPKLLTFTSHQQDHDTRSPSQVLRLHRDGEEAWEVEEIYLNDGDPISGSATGAVHDGLMVIGPVYDPWLLACEVSD